MKTPDTSPEFDPLSPRTLDGAKGVRGKYYERFQSGTNLVAIAPDLIDAFPDEEAVNQALRSLKQLAQRSTKQAS